MIVYLIAKGGDAILFALISIIPVFETPVWFATQLPDILFRIASFNWYLPVYETVGNVIILIGFTLVFKIVKIVLNVVRIDLNE